MLAAPRRLASFSFLVCLANATLPSMVAAQLLEAPVLQVFGTVHADHLATGRDGTILVVGETNNTVLSRRFASPFSPPGAALILAENGMTPAAVAALRQGGYAAAWGDRIAVPEPNSRVVTQRLSTDGVPTGTAVQAGDIRFTASDPGIAALGDGFVAAFREGGEIIGRRFDETGTPIGGPFVIAQQQTIAPTLVGAVPGGFLAVWGRDDDIGARLMAADATPLAPAFTVATSFELTGFAVNPAGTLAAVVGIAHESDPSPGEVRLRFFAPDGSSISGDIAVGPGLLGGRPGVASDTNGNFLVVAGPGISARAYDASGTAFGPAVTLSPVAASKDAKVIGRRDGGFFVLRAAATKTWVAGVTLCTPGSAVCGDGTLSSTCEVCDDGGANSDTTPDACRTDCVRARCGDGTTDTDEQCDDGNGANCDGCSELCTLEVGTTCGDGTPGPVGCGEVCDDGNAIGGDGCSFTCDLERILGGGKLQTDCYAAWRIDNPSNDPRFDKRGGVNPRQTCRDNDPACDFDGGVVGSCTFHLAVCVNNRDPAGCFASRLEAWTVTSPTAKQALVRPPLAAVRSALEGAVVPSVVGTSDVDACSPNAAIVVPLRGSVGSFKTNKLKLKTRAQIYGGAFDTDGLQLRCDP